MKRIVITGLFLMMVFALSGVTAGSASAAYVCRGVIFGSYPLPANPGQQCEGNLGLYIPGFKLVLVTGAKEVESHVICALVEPEETSLYDGPNCGASEKHEGKGEYEKASTETEEEHQEKEKKERESESKEDWGPKILPEQEHPWTGKLVSSAAVLEKHNGEGVSCKAATLEGTGDPGAPTGQFHTHLKECKGPVSSTCTGLGEESGVILSLGSWHLVYDTLKSSLSEAGVAALLSLAEVHFSCKVLSVEELVTVPSGGMALCLVANPTATRTFEFKCQENGKKEPEETKYYNSSGTLVSINRLKAALNEGTAEEAIEVFSGTASLPQNVELMR